MRRLDPGTSVALPPVSAVDVHTDGAGWTVTERRTGKPVRKTSLSPRVQLRADPGASPGPTTARGSPRDGSPEDGPRAQASTSPASVIDMADPFSPGPAGRQPTLMKGRAIENWLNRTLCQAGKPHSAAVANTAAKQMQGLAQFGVDVAALEKLGLDAQQSERVYRAMFVYSQGLHAVLQEAVGRAKSSSAALLVLWKAFTAVMEHAGQSDEKNESLASLVQRGNEEEKAKMEGKFKDQIAMLQASLSKVNAQRRSLQEEVARLREDESRLRGEGDMYRSELEASMAKNDKEIKLRADAEVRYLDKTRWAESLQAQMDKERREGSVIKQQLKEEITAREMAQVELESMRTQVKVLESQVTTYKQGIAEAAQQKQRHEQQVGMLKQQLDRHDRKMQEIRDLLEQEQDTSKRLQDQTANQQREMRRLERQCEDELHVRRELVNERDSLRDKLERLEKELGETVEERRALTKQFNDLKMSFRTVEIELKRKTESCERAEQELDKSKKAHQQLMEEHREVKNELDGLREDVAHLDSQLAKESELRKSLQFERKQQASQLQALTVSLETCKLNLQTTQKELSEATDAKVKLEHVVRDTKSSMQKLNTEHQVELKAAIQKVAMLEKVIADERTERRKLVMETQEVAAKREDMYDQLRKRDAEIRELRRQRLDREEEADRFKTLLRAQEQRNADQLVVVDKYHAVVANHNMETREMQVLLESERAQMKKQLQQLQDSYNSDRAALEQKIEHWKFSYEDVLSYSNFNPVTEKVRTLEVTVDELHAEVKQLSDDIVAEREKANHVEMRLLEITSQLQAAKARVAEVEQERDEWRAKFQQALLDLERQSFARGDVEHAWERIKKNTEAFDEMKALLEKQLDEEREKNEELVKLMHRPKADAETQVYVYTCLGQAQTDLSYQYLESSARLNQDVGRRERLDALKGASRFVEDAEERRDFTAHMRTAGALPVAAVEMRFEDAKGAARLHIAAPRAKGVAGGYAGAPEPYPTAPKGPVLSPQRPRVGPLRGPVDLAGASVTRRLDV